MEPADAKTGEVLSSGGFRLEVSAGSLTATYCPPNLRRTLACYAVGFCLAAALDHSWPGLVVIAVVLGLSLHWKYWGTVHNVRLTPQRLEILETVRGKVTATTDYSIEQVKRLRFAAVSFRGRTAGLVFEAAGKKVTALHGLRSPEARRILKDAQRLGFETEYDPGTAMMVEMDLASRKSRIGRWLLG